MCTYRYIVPTPATEGERKLYQDVSLRVLMTMCDRSIT